MQPIYRKEYFVHAGVSLFLQYTQGKPLPKHKAHKEPKEDFGEMPLQYSNGAIGVWLVVTHSQGIPSQLPLEKGIWGKVHNHWGLYKRTQPIRLQLKELQP